MSLQIEQKPLYRTMPVGQDIIFSISESNIVANKFRVKFVAEIFVSNSLSGTFNVLSKVGTLKVIPNNKGVGIFSLEPMLQSYVKPQNEGTNFDGVFFSTFKGTAFSKDNAHPIHLIDEYSCNENNFKYFGLKFNVEYFDSATSSSLQTLSTPILSRQYMIFNGVINFDAVLKSTNGNYGYELNQEKLVFNDFYGSLGKFLSNAPLVQYAKLTDYGTISFFNHMNTGTYSFQVGTDNVTINMVKKFKIFLYNTAGNSIGGFEIECNTSNGGFQFANDDSLTRVMYLGAFPANFDGAGNSFWNNNKANTSYYTLQAFDDVDEAISQIYTVNIIGNSCKGFESVRLTWLNQYGTWDYYTFRKKSVKSLQTNRTSYTQERGTWNEDKYRIRGYKGGKKNFRVNTKQMLTVNTDFLVEDEAVWFENLINSTEVYILNGYDADINDTRYGITNKYVEPVSVKTSNYIRKTKANDKLIQYTFELEKTHNKKAHSV